MIDISSSIQDLVQAFEDWEQNQYQSSMTALRSGLNDILYSLNDCSNSGTSPQKFVTYLKKDHGGAK
jgi:hypothetical protein